MGRWMCYGLAVLLASSGALWAEPLRWEQVPAQGQWIVHLDFDAARQTTVVWPVLGFLVGQEPAKIHLERISEAAGLDPARGLFGLTFFGPQFGPHDGVVLVHARTDQQRLLNLLRQRPDYQQLDHVGHAIHCWTETREKQRFAVFGCFYAPTTIVFGRQQALVQNTLDTLDGKAPHVRDSSTLRGQPARPGTVLAVRAVGLSSMHVPLMSPLLRKSERLELDFGEEQGAVFLRAQMDFQSLETAKQVSKVLEGLLAMAALQLEEDTQATAALQTAQVKCQQRSVCLDWQAPAQAVLELLVKLAGALRKP